VLRFASNVTGIRQPNTTFRSRPRSSAYLTSVLEYTQSRKAITAFNHAVFLSENNSPKVKIVLAYSAALSIVVLTQWSFQMTAFMFTAIKIECGMSQSQLSKHIGKSIRTISRYETGAAPIPHLVERFMNELKQRISRGEL